MKKYLLALLFMLLTSPTWAATTSGYSFDGDDYASMSNIHAELQGESGATVSFWVKLDSLESQCFYSNSIGALYFCYDGDGSIGAGTGKFLMGQNLGANVLISDATPIVNTGIWYHFVVVFNSSVWTLYIDGTTYTTSGGAFGYTLAHLNLGGTFDIGRSQSFNKYVKGTIDDFQIYNVALDQAMVTSLYGNGSPSEISADTTGLIAYWKMNGTATTGAASVIDSQTARNNTGQLGANSSSGADDPAINQAGIVSDGISANAAPVAVADSYSVNEGATLN
ncbi:hypothetical protein CXF93_06895, partial [Moritella sp. Urea-trap-13]